jgi:hypothetical protein
MTWLPIVIAFGCSFLLNRETWEEYVRGLALFLGGFLCAAILFQGGSQP